MADLLQEGTNAVKNKGQLCLEEFKAMAGKNFQKNKGQN